jgi:hypothetical protein
MTQYHRTMVLDTLDEAAACYRAANALHGMTYNNWFRTTWRDLIDRGDQRMKRVARIVLW